MYIRRNYGPTIRTQLVAEGKGHQQVLWLFGEDQQLTEVGTMNLFVHWINENGGRHKINTNINYIPHEWPIAQDAQSCYVV